MGACSSKPKTTEFEGSMEPRKPTDVAAHRPPETERSLENLADDHGKDAPVKAGGEGAHASTEAVQTTPELDKDEGLSTRALSRSAEGSSEAQSDVLGEREAVHKESSDEVEQKESKVDVVSDEVVQKDGVGGGGVADSASVNINGADNKETSVVDEAKTCEDKAVMSEETGSNQGDAAYVDKTVSLDEEKAPETPKKRIIIVPEEEEASTALDSAQFASVESPIIGVVQPVELLNDEKDVSKIGATEAGIVGACEDLLEDSKVAAESPVKGAGEVDARASATEDVQEDVLAPAREASSEGIEASSVEIVAPTSAAETLAPVSALETRAPAKADPLKDGEEGASQPQEAPSEAVVDISPAIMDSTIDMEECSTDTKVGVPLDESVVNQNEDSHASAVGHGGSVDSLEMETPKTIENVDSEVATIELKTKDAQEESVKEKGGPIVEEMDVSNGQTKALVTEEVHEDGRPIVTLGESIPEREEKDEQIQESTVEVGKQTADKPRMEHTSSGDFEDASDVLLKLEASKSIGSGHIPS